MDRNFWYHQEARERQTAISKELATRHLLQETGRQPASARQVWKVAVRFSPIAAGICIFLVYRVFGS